MSAVHIVDSTKRNQFIFSINLLSIIVIVDRCRSKKAALGELVLGEWQSSFRWSRRDEVILCHFYIAHTFLTHSFILAGDCPPQCEHCQRILTARHIFMRCPHLQTVRHDLFENDNVMESFQFHPQLHY